MKILSITNTTGESEGVEKNIKKIVRLNTHESRCTERGKLRNEIRFLFFIRTF